MPPAVAARVAETITRLGLLAPGEPVLALLSGGADSVLLVRLLVELGHPVEALHVEHARRAESSDGDARFCARLCAELGVPLRRVDGAVPDGPNVEARLREVRLAAAEAAARDRAVATGHTASDRAETALYRLATSGGVRALPALRARRGRLVRPLIELTRAEVRAELERRGAAWREDASNDDRRFSRNRIRHDVLPALRELNPAAERNIARAASRAADERDLLDGLAAALVADDGAVDLDRLAAAHPALQRLALESAAARAGVALRHADVEALRALGRHGSERRSLAGGAWAERTYTVLTFAPPARSPTPPPQAVDLPPCGVVPFGVGRIETSTGAGAAVDPSLARRLHARPWRPGDRLAGRSRPCADLLQAARVPLAERARYPVIEADGRLVCLPGIAVAPDWRRPYGTLVTYTADAERTPA